VCSGKRRSLAESPAQRGNKKRCVSVQELSAESLAWTVGGERGYRIKEIPRELARRDFYWESLFVGRGGTSKKETSKKPITIEKKKTHLTNAGRQSGVGRGNGVLGRKNSGDINTENLSR